MAYETYTLPVHWASYLRNSDPTGLEDDEQATVDRFVELENLGHCVEVGEDTSFVAYHDARLYGVLASDCAEFTFETLA
jgi:hypothetical protein